MDPTFGRDSKGNLISIVDNLINLLAKVPHEGVPSCVAQTMLIEEYETFYRIYNHDGAPTGTDAQVLMPIIAKHAKEDVMSFNSLADRIDQFIEMNIHVASGLSLTEYLELPRHIGKMIRRSCEERLKKDNVAGDEFKKQLENNRG